MLITENSDGLLGTSQLEILYGEDEEFMGRSFLRRVASRTKRVAKRVAKNPIVKVAAYTNPITAPAMLLKNRKAVSRVVRRVAKNPIVKVAAYTNPITASAMLVKNRRMIGRVASRTVRRAAPIARAALQNKFIQQTAASFIPGGSAALNAFNQARRFLPTRNTPRFVQGPTPSIPTRGTGAGQTRPMQAPVRERSVPVSELSKYKVPLAVGGGVAALGLLALAMKKSK